MRSFLIKSQKHLDRLPKMLAAAHDFDECALRVQISPAGKYRTPEQNRYLFGVIYPPILRHFQDVSEHGDRITIDMVHEAMKQIVLGGKTNFINGKIMVSSTSKMTPSAFNDYMDAVCAAAVEEGVFVEPGEW